MNLRNLSLFAALALGACATSSDSDLESTSSELVSASSPVDHGVLAWATPQTATLSRAEGFHAWQVSLDQGASVSFITAPVAGGPTVNTVLVLYRQQANGTWGTAIAQNDNGPTPPWSRIEQTLTAGTYRILVKGAARTVSGAFALTASCNGAGCGTCVPEPLTLTSEDASALAPSTATFNAGAPNGGTWCSLSTASLYSTPACPEGPVDLAAIVEQVIASNQELGGYTFADGAVQTTAEIQQSVPFGTSCSPGGPGVAQAVAANISGTAPQGWLLTSEGSCHNCHEFNHYLVLWYPDGNVLVLPYVTGYDS